MTASAIETLRKQLGDRYAVERQLGRGGMGAVYLARDRQLDRLLAIKVLPEEFATQRDLRERFLRETRTAAGFSHPNIVPVFAVEDREDVLAMTMGYVEGESLAERVSRTGPLTIRETVRLLDDVGYALAYAHGRDVVHRDIKPDNIMIERATGRALVMDFGISRVISSAISVDTALTRVGEVVGTPEYMSPEQASGDAVDGRSDLYALGLVAWFALIGKAAVSGTSTQQVLVKQLTETLPLISTVRADVPSALAEAIARCLRKAPSERFETAESFVESVDAVRQGEPEVPVPIRLFAQELAAVGPTLLVGALATWLIWIFIVRVQGWHPFDALSQIMIVLAIMASRLLHVWQATRRVMLMGFSVDDVRRGLAALMDERRAGRAMLRADAALVRRRRIIVVAAIAALPLAFVMARIATGMRTQIGPNAWHVPPLAMGLYVLRSILLGVGIVTLVRSPLRMPLGERLFRWTWLGGLGRSMLRRAHDGLDTTAATRSGTHSALGTKAVTAATPMPSLTQESSRPSVGLAPQLDALTARVEQLERWRESARDAPVGDS